MMSIVEVVVDVNHGRAALAQLDNSLQTGHRSDGRAVNQVNDELDEYTDPDADQTTSRTGRRTQRD